MLSNLVDEKCCGSCSHSAASPCPDFVACLSDGPICHDSDECSQLRSERMSALRREVIQRPVIFVGSGTCELGAGAGQTLTAVKQYLADNGIEADVVEVGCIGLCAFEPLMDVQLPGRARVCFHSVTADKVKSLLDSAMAGEFPAEFLIGQFRNTALPPWDGVPYVDEHPFLAPQKRWVLVNCGILSPRSIDEYIAHGGYKAFAGVVKGMTPQQLCDNVEASGLRGRGGGGFPAARKWKIALNSPGDQKYMICNADEGDPGAFMDRALIEGDPYRLIEGLSIAAYAIGATKAYIYIRAEYPLAVKLLKDAIAKAKSYGLLGENILDSGYSLDIKLKMGAGAFVCGEETALIRSIEGKRGMPRPRPPFPAVQGLFGKPTIINNVETMANLPSILSNGAEWFSSTGTATSKGTKVFALSGKVTFTGLVEVPMGTRLRDIIFDIGGGIPDGGTFKAVQIGGPSGGCIPQEHLDIEIDYESLKTVGAMMGSGGLVVMDDKTCMVDVAKFFMNFIQSESCGKCIPCREGTRRMLEILERITAGRKSENQNDALLRFQGVVYLRRLAEVIRDTSLCGLGQTASNPVLSTLRWFRDEYEDHIFDRKCRAGVCTELLTYSIDAEACKGCTLCAKQCPAEAIMGSQRSPHYIIPNKCIGCGNCLTACRLNAVVVN
jgi:NADH:ubiquinone oxidoreductase subunit F (NADH-binding)/NAD-dependent dihydropyrimidine dehydrogenase PreA subunit/(2Fe-2S) ferredoxin